MRNFITNVFWLLVSLVALATILVGFLWLLDFKPNNLYLVWSVLCKSLVISFLFYILFGGRKN